MHIIVIVLSLVLFTFNYFSALITAGDEKLANILVGVQVISVIGLQSNWLCNHNDMSYRGWTWFAHRSMKIGTRGQIIKTLKKHSRLHYNINICSHSFRLFMYFFPISIHRYLSTYIVLFDKYQ